MTDVLQAFAGWYARQCDGDWEHSHGIRITTLDNPGWRLDINVSGTEREGFSFEAVREERDELDWIHAWKEQEIFKVACGPLNLAEALQRFLDWVHDSADRPPPE